MQEVLNRLRQRGNEDRGFTMIELLVVVVIIGVLVAIAVPVYLNYRQGAADKSAASDVRSAIIAVEQFYTDNGNTYPEGTIYSDGETSLDLGGEPAQSVKVSPGNELGFTNNGTSYVLCAKHEDGEKVYKYDSAVGGSVKTDSDSETVADCLGDGS